MPKRHASDRGLSSLRVTGKEIGRRAKSPCPQPAVPPPWTIEEANDACFIVKDHNGHALAYVCFENKPAGSAAANLLTKGEARRIAAQA